MDVEVGVDRVVGCVLLGGLKGLMQEKSKGGVCDD